MEQFDPNIPGLMEGALARVAVTDPQPFVGGVGNHVVDPQRPFRLRVEWEIFGQLVPLWLSALAGNWNVSVYAESLGGGPEVRLGSTSVPTTAVQPCTVNTQQANCTKFSAEITVPPNRLVEHSPGTNVGGIYKLVAAVFLNSNIAGVPGFDLVGYSEGPIIQAENPA